MIVPAEYTTIDVLSDGRFLLTRYDNQASSFYYADASGTVTPIQTPVKGTYFGMAGDDRFFIGVYAKRPLTAAVQQPAEQYDIPTLVLLDENMKVIRDDINGAFHEWPDANSDRQYSLDWFPKRSNRQRNVRFD